MAISIGDALLKLGVDDKDLHTSLNRLGGEVNSQLNSLKGGTKNASTAFTAMGVAIGGMAVMAGQAIMSNLSEALNKVTVQAANLADEILDTASATSLTTTEVQKFKLAADMEGKSFEMVNGMVKFYSAAMKDATSASKGATPEMVNLQSQLDAIQKSEVDDKIASIQREIARVNPASKGAAEKIFKFNEQIANIRKDVVTAGKIADIKDQMASLSAPTNEAGEAFKYLNIDMDQFSKLTTGQQLDILLPKINAITNANDRMTIGQKLLGRGFLENLDVINTYVSKAPEIEAAVKKFGIPEDQLLKAAELKSEMGLLTFVFDNISVKIGAALIPSLLKLAPLIIEVADKMNVWLEDPEHLASLDRLVAGIGNVIDKIIELTSWWDKVNSDGVLGMLMNPAGAGAEVLGKMISYPGGTVNKKATMSAAGKIPQGIYAYARGGIVPGIGPQLAMVHGGETIIPSGGTQEIHTHLYMDGRQIAESVDRVLYNRLNVSGVRNYT